MNRRLMILPGAIALAGAIALGACTTTAPAASTGTGPGASLPAGATLPPVGLPSTPVTLPSLGTSQLCAGKPTFSLETPQPSFPNDPELAAKFPAQIAGVTPDQIQTYKLLDEFCLFGGLGLDQMAVAFSQAGVDITNSSIGNATYSLPAPCTDATESPCVNTDDVNLTAIRTPGSDANKMVAGLAQFAIALGQQDKLSNLQQTNVGGKNVFTSTQTDGTVSYIYPAGDTLWLFDSKVATEAATVLSALP
jgi:hypothetical protein